MAQDPTPEEWKEWADQTLTKSFIKELTKLRGGLLEGFLSMTEIRQVAYQQGMINGIGRAEYLIQELQEG